MLYVPIIVGSVRRGRSSIRAARYILERLRRSGQMEVELLDLLEYNFPIMEERLRLRDDPPPRLAEFAAQVERGDALVIVTPEYNNGYPGVLKNALDYLLPEMRRKPVGIVTVSSGVVGGANCLAQLRLVMFGMGAVPIPARLLVSKVNETLSEDGTPLDPAFDRRAQPFVDELVWFATAISAQRSREAALAGAPAAGGAPAAAPR